MQLEAPRYTTLPLPARRFLPGGGQRPDIESLVRSASGPEGVSSLRLSPQQWRGNVRYLFGCDLYNHGFWWEAHEAWEALWHRVDRHSAPRHYLQALIQIAACGLKLHQRRRLGLERLLRTSANHLDRLYSIRSGLRAGEAYMGLRVAQWHVDVLAYYGIDGAGRHAHDREAYPYVRLEFE